MIQDTNIEKVKNHKHSSMKTKKIISKIICYTILILICLIWLYPIVWIVLSSFQVSGTVTSSYFPKHLTFKHYHDMLFNGLKDVYFVDWWLNTLKVAIFTCLISTIIQLCVAYVMSKLKFRLRKAYLNFALILGLFPGFMSMIAIYFILKAMNLTHSLPALVLCYSAGSGLGFYVAKGFFDVIPNALIESARLDGANNETIFRKIILPMSKPIMIYTALVTFMGPWMDFIFASVIMGNDPIIVQDPVYRIT